jgi:predicted lipoprotein with Yx(FWY)xxD motif
MRSTLFLLVLTAAAVLVPQAMTATRDSSPVQKVTAPKFGAIIATRGRLALYTWDKEKDKKIRCTAACAKAWPPLTVAKGTMVARHLAGVMGTFGETMRPDGATQVTLDGRPLYTYHADTAKKILCDGVDGWHVVRVH